MSEKQTTGPRPDWTFLSNHAHVLLVLARDSEAKLRDVATSVGITERAVQRIVADLEAAGYLRHEKVGRCNRYHIFSQRPLRHPIEAHIEIGSLLKMILDVEPGRTSSRGRKAL